jgi:hypothetical protein
VVGMSEAPAELRKVLQTALAKKPEKRWQTAREMGGALERTQAQVVENPSLASTQIILPAGATAKTLEILRPGGSSDRLPGWLAPLWDIGSGANTCRRLRR